MLLFSDLPSTFHYVLQLHCQSSPCYCLISCYKICILTTPASQCQPTGMTSKKGFSQGEKRRRDQEELRDSERAEPDLTGGRDEEGRETMMQCKTGPSDQR